MGETGAFVKDLEPIAKVDENVQLIGGGSVVFARIVYIEPLPSIRHDFGSLSAGSSTSPTEFTELRMPEDELGQFRLAPLDNITFQVNQKRSTQRFATQQTVSSIEASVFRDNLSEIFVLELDAPFLTVTNPTSSTLPKTRVVASGFRYQLDRLVGKPAKFTTVPVAGAALRPRRKGTDTARTLGVKAGIR